MKHNMMIKMAKGVAIKIYGEKLSETLFKWLKCSLIKSPLTTMRQSIS